MLRYNTKRLRSSTNHLWVAIGTTAAILGLVALLALTTPTSLIPGRLARPAVPAASLGGSMVTVYGASGTFGAIGSDAAAASAGKRPVGHAVPGWGLLPGQAISIAVGTPDGAVVMGNEPQSGAQAYASAATMAVSVFDPTADSFQNVVIPTSTGYTSVLEPGQQVGGADVVGLAADGGQVAFVPAWPYRGWDVDTFGEYPGFGYVGPAPSGSAPSGSWAYVAGSGRTPAAIRGSGGVAQQGADGPCVVVPTSYAAPVANCRTPSSIGSLPLSHSFAIAQYGADVANGRNSGGLMILGPAGDLMASYAYPNASVAGVPRFVLPREIDVDPIAVDGVERFVVVFDVFDTNGQGSPFTMQEFTYQASTQTLAPVSAPILPGQTVKGGQAYVETAHFDHQGNLWVAESVMGNWAEGGNVIEYSAASVTGRLSSGACAAARDWPTTQWGLSCPPDFTISHAVGHGMVRSVAEDTASGSMLFTTLAGSVFAVAPTSNPLRPWVKKPDLDLGLDKLVDRSHVLVSPRPGFVDPATRSLWIPIEQTGTVAACAPVSFACQQAPAATGQWLYRVDLNRFLG
jgi:hypothetical protein